MDRRSLISGALGGAAGVVVGRELVPSPAGAAADVDRSEFDALTARVAYLEGFHPPMPPPHVPKFSGNVSLPNGFVVPFGEVWDFDPDVSTTVEVGKNVVVAGTLQMRPANPGVVHTLRFVGVDEEAFVGGGMVPLDTDVGLWVIGAGVLDAVGSPKSSWVRAAGSLAAGATSVPLSSAPTGWAAGDTVVLTPTHAWSEAATKQHDNRTIGSVSGVNVSLATGVQYPHPAVTVGDGFTLTAEVLNLTRNVNIEGTATGRAHIFINSSVPQHLANVALRFLGPRKLNGRVTFYGPVTSGVQGRYPLHIHMCGDGSRGSTITNVVAERCGNHAFVAHESHGVTFTGCVAHDIFDDAYWWDPAPAVTHDTTFQSCVASYVRFDPEGEGYRLAGFFLGLGNGNKILDCVASGVQGYRGAAGFSWPEMLQTSVWEFKRNVAHHCRHAGLFVWQNNDDPHVIEDFVCYRNAVGIDHGAYGNSYEYRRGWLFENEYMAVIVHATARERGMRFGELTFDLGGRYASAIVFVAHVGNLLVTRTRIEGCTFTGHTGEALAVDADWYNTPDLVDVVECGLSSVHFKRNPAPTTSFRFQNGTTATEITPSSTTSIAPFSTYVKPTWSPFPLVNAA
jgi:hypothetical protein